MPNFIQKLFFELFTASTQLVIAMFKNLAKIYTKSSGELFKYINFAPDLQKEDIY